MKRDGEGKERGSGFRKEISWQVIKQANHRRLLVCRRGGVKGKTDASFQDETERFFKESKCVFVVANDSCVSRRNAEISLYLEPAFSSAFRFPWPSFFRPLLCGLHFSLSRSSLVCFLLAL